MENTEQILKAIAELREILQPAKKPIPEIVTEKEISEIYGKSIYWFPNLRCKHTLYHFEPVKREGTRKLCFYSKEVIKFLKGLGHEPK